MKVAFLKGFEFGCVLAGAVFMMAGMYPAAVAHVAFAAYCRYARAA